MSAPPNTSPGDLANHLARLFAGALQALIKPMGLSTGAFPIMLHLWQKDGLTPRDPVGLVGVEQAMMANSLARMERDGLIQRRPAPQDGRAKRIWLTEKGRSLQQQATSAAQNENLTVLAGLSHEESLQLVRLIRKAIETSEVRQKGS